MEKVGKVRTLDRKRISQKMNGQDEMMAIIFGNVSVKRLMNQGNWD
jgi:hypothetical protein